MNEKRTCPVQPVPWPETVEHLARLKMALSYRVASKRSETCCPSGKLPQVCWHKNFLLCTCADTLVAHIFHCRQMATCPGAVCCLRSLTDRLCQSYCLKSRWGAERQWEWAPLLLSPGSGRGERVLMADSTPLAVQKPSLRALSAAPATDAARRALQGGVG